MKTIVQVNENDIVCAAEQYLYDYRLCCVNNIIRVAYWPQHSRLEFTAIRQMRPDRDSGLKTLVRTVLTTQHVGKP